MGQRTKVRMSEYTPAEAARGATFQAATVGMRAWPIAKAFNEIRSGVDYRGLTKNDLRDEYVRGDLSHISGQELRDALNAQKPPNHTPERLHSGRSSV